MQAAFVLLVFSVGYGFFFFITHSRKIRNSIQNFFGEKRSVITWTLFQRGAGFICLGILPAVSVLSFSEVPLSDVGVKFEYSLSSLMWTLATGTCVLVFSFISSKKAFYYARVPKSEPTHRNMQAVLLNSGSWMLYLLAYEFLFRGVVFLTLLVKFGFVQAMVITTVLYVVVHFAKGAGETLGSLPFGVLLCLMTWQAGTIWPAFILHLILALSFDFFPSGQERGKSKR